MKNTRISKAKRTAEDIMISLAIQDAIDAAAIRATPEQVEAMEAMIAQLALHFKPAEA